MKKVVVIVEDEPDVAELQKIALEDFADVRIISDNFICVFDPATWMHVDVAVIDLMLPDVFGEDICRFLGKHFPSIRRVICTAKPTYVLPELQTIAEAVLQKPFNTNEFTKAVLHE